MSCYVILKNPSRESYFPLVDEDGTLMMFETEEKATTAAECTLFGSHGYYDVFEFESDRI